MSATETQPPWITDATRGDVVRRALAYAVVVGAVLISINHGDAILRTEFDRGRLLKIGLTVLVPYLVKHVLRRRRHAAGAAHEHAHIANSASTFAAQMKSFSDNPPTA